AIALNPITPHWSEEVWSSILKTEHSITTPGVWPDVPSPDAKLSATRDYVRATSSNITSQEGQQAKKIAKGKNTAFDPNKDKQLTIFVAQRWPEWQEKYIELVRGAFNEMKVSVDVKALTPKIDKKDMKKAMPFVQGLKKMLEVDKMPPQDVFERTLVFDEVQVLGQMAPMLRAQVKKCVKVEIVKVNADGKGGIVVGEDGKEGERKAELPQVAEGAVPGNPSFLFNNVEA
ncbi:hypothetical protein LTS18_008570, partial [Coniosporium uncinatum]